jgi:hypothetical protein
VIYIKQSDPIFHIIRIKEEPRVINIIWPPMPKQEINFYLPQPEINVNIINPRPQPQRIPLHIIRFVPGGYVDEIGRPVIVYLLDGSSLSGQTIYIFQDGTGRFVDQNGAEVLITLPNGRKFGKGDTVKVYVLDSGKRENNWNQKHVLVLMQRKFQAQFNKFKTDTQRYLLRKLTLILNQKGQMIERDVESVVLRAIKRVMVRQQNIRIRVRHNDYDDDEDMDDGEECTEISCSISVRHGGGRRHTVTHHHRVISRRVIYPSYHGRGRRPLFVEQESKAQENSEEESEEESE